MKDFKTYKTVASAKRAIEKAGLHGMEVRYDNLAMHGGPSAVLPVVIYELHEDKVEIEKRGFATEGMKKQVGTIDLTPTWTGLMPALIAALQDGTPTGQQIAREEIMRAAGLLDQYIALAKKRKD